MQRIVHTVELRAPPQEVFDFVTNPVQWVRWHPATHSVRGVEDRPLRLGERVIEHIQAAHREFDAEWKVVACEAPQLWQLETATPLGASVLTYSLQSSASGGTRFERTCTFRSEGAWSLLDANVTKWMLAAQAKKALKNLRRIV
jgi:uncharacterized protein YndB with AHSA1/START domain